jgi:four helix bundle protein
MEKKKDDLNKRIFNFVIRVFKFLPQLPRTPEFNVIRYQLGKSSSSSGANYEEAQAGSSKADFNNKVRISFRDRRESNYWPKIIKATVEKFKSIEELEVLIDESEQLKKFLVR